MGIGEIVIADGECRAKGDSFFFLMEGNIFYILMETMSVERGKLMMGRDGRIVEIITLNR